MKRCGECGLRIRAEGKTDMERLQAHEDGLRHKQRKEALEQAAKEAARLGR